MAKLTGPNAALFDPNALEQIFAKGAIAPDNMAGISGALMLLSRGSRMSDQDNYLGALNQTNQMDAALQRQEIAAKLREQGMKSAVDLIKEGYSPASTRAGGDIFNDPNEADVITALNLERDLKRSTIAKNNRTGTGGGGTKDTVTVQTSDPGYTNPDGSPVQGPTIYTAKSGDPVKAQQMAQTARTAADIKRNPNATPEQKARADAVLKEMRQQRVMQPD